MRCNLLVISILLNLSADISAQDDSILSASGKINRFLENYDQISVYPLEEDLYHVDEIGFDETLITRGTKLWNDLYSEDIFNGDSIAHYDAISLYQSFIIEELNQILSHEDFSKYDLSELLDQRFISVVKSSDNKLINISLDAKNGGTYRMFLSWNYYEDIEFVKLEHPHDSEQNSTDPFQVFLSDGYHTIHTMPSEEGTKYLMQGFIRACSSCFINHVNLVAFENGHFKSYFSYELSSRSPENEINFNPIHKTIEINYTTDDLSPFCECEIDEDLTLDYTELTPNSTHKCKCFYEFNGSTFELSTSESTLIKE